MNGAEEQHSIAGLQLIVEHGLLRVGFAGQYQIGFTSSGCTSASSVALTDVVSQD